MVSGHTQHELNEGAALTVTETLFTIKKIRKEHECPSSGEWIEKL